MGKLNEKQWAAIRTRYLKGESFATIANDYGVSEAALQYRGRKERLQQCKAFAIETSSSKESSPQGEKGNSLIVTRESVDSIGQRVRSRLAANIEATVARADSYAPSDLREENQLETVLASVTKRAATVFGWSESQASTLVSVNLLGALPDRELDVTPTERSG